MTASRKRADAPDAGSRYTGCVATFPTTQTVVSFIVFPSLARPVRPGGHAYGPVPYGCVCRADRVRRDRRGTRLPPPGRARRDLWTTARLWTTPSPGQVKGPARAVRAVAHAPRPRAPTACLGLTRRPHPSA
nr:hypothetical protein StreXyl84_41880 [Streptomyces sp. Xyl84]